MQGSDPSLHLWGSGLGAGFHSQEPDNLADHLGFNDPDGLQETLAEGVARSVIEDDSGELFSSSRYTPYGSYNEGFEPLAQQLEDEYAYDGQYQEDDEGGAQQAYEDEFEDEGEDELAENEEDADYQVYAHLQECFPTASHEALAAAVHHAKGDVVTALQIMGDALNAVANCRPCRHKMQGGCYRADCRFDHNLEATPCRYWMQGYCSSGPESCAFLHDVITPERKQQLENSGEIPASATVLPPTSAISEFPPLLDVSSQSKKSSTTTVHTAEATVAAAAGTPPAQLAATEILQSLFGSSSGSRSLQQTVDRRSSPASGTPSYRDAALRAGSSKPEPEASEAAAIAAGVAGGAGVSRLSAASAKAARGGWIAGGEAIRTDYEAARAKARELAIARNNLYMEATKSFVAGGKGAARDLARRARAIDIEMRRHHQQAARALFGRRNTQHSVFGQGAIDLHGLHIAEAKEVLRELIPELHKHGLRRVRIITGTGHHSAATQMEGRMFAHARHLVEEELGFNTQEIRDPRGFLGGIEVLL